MNGENNLNNMVNLESARSLALGFEESSEQPHFEKNSFRIHKKIFATLDSSHHRICVKLTEVEQSVFSSINAEMIFPVPGAWGKQGWTFINLKKVNKSILLDALTKSYCNIAPKKLAAKYQQ
jgi:hypothetical protein